MEVLRSWSTEESKERQRQESVLKAKRRAEFAQIDIDKIKPVLEELKERNEKIKVLLPFEKLEVLEKEIQILEANYKIYYHEFAVENYNENYDETVLLENKIKKINDRTAEKKQEYFNLKAESIKLMSKYKFPYELWSDPRVKPYREFTNDFKVNKIENTKPAFRYYPVDEDLETILKRSGNRYPKEKLIKVNKAIQDLREKILDDENFLNEL